MPTSSEVGWVDVYKTVDFDGDHVTVKVVNPFAEEDKATKPDIEANPPSDGTILADSNSLPYPIFDSLAVKCCAIQFAMEAAVSVLSIDSRSRGVWYGIQQ
jgi:hypothetical protein